WAAVARSLPDEKHVAVLPFRAVGGGPDAQAFSDGLVETLASGLTQLEQYQGALWVVPASEVRAQGVESPSAARRMLGATLVVTGSVQRSGGRVRVPLTLVDAETMRQVRSETIDVPEARLNTLPAEVAAALEGMLDLELQAEARPDLTASGTESAEAFDAVMQGTGYMDRRDDPANLERAAGLFRRAIAADPRYALAHARLGEAYAHRFVTGRDERWLVRAEASAREALALAPDAPATHVLLSRVARLRGAHPEALASARRALALDPASDDAMVALARAHAAAGDDARAEQAYLRAVRLKPGYWSTQNTLGVFYFENARYGEAADRFREAVRLAPGNSQALLNLGSAVWTEGRTDEARALFERSIAARPNAEAFSNLGTIAYDEGRFAESVGAYRRSLALAGSDVVVWGNLASAYEALERPADVRRAYVEGVRQGEARLSVNPHDADVLATVAGFYAELGRRREARRAADRAAGFDPSVEVQVVLAGVYGMLGEDETARRWLRQALTEGYPRALAAEDPVLAPYLGGARSGPVL
ncbi:MAG TPA: tetratricopeptide repeat protein, partial [Rubricoccaceae bacterium]